MKDTTIEYFTNELKENPVRAEEMYSKLEKHPDILQEFENWLTTRQFPDEDNGSVIVNGYSAKKLSEVNTLLEPIGIYNYLVYLREDPEKALLELENGLPTK